MDIFKCSVVLLFAVLSGCSTVKEQTSEDLVRASHSGHSQLVHNLREGRDQTIVVYGTSLTADGAWVPQITALLNRYYPFKANIINSAKSNMWSDWGVANLDDKVIAHNPDTVIIEFAINDAYMPNGVSPAKAKTNLENMISRILASNPNCEIILMVMNPPIGDGFKERPKIADYYQVYRDVADQHDLLLVDHFNRWMNILTLNINLFKGLVPDGLHPNAQGATVVITPTIIEALGIGYYGSTDH